MHTEINAYRKLLEGGEESDSCNSHTYAHTKSCMNADVKIDFRVSTL